jgi:hypothetical protein
MLLLFPYKMFLIRVPRILIGEKYMNFRKVIPIMVICSVLISGFASVKNVPTMVRLIEEVFLDGGKIDVVAFAVSNENAPAAAYSTASGQYLVVYESYSTDIDIYGQFVDAESGDLIGGWFQIANSSAEESAPAVVYDPFEDRFLVVWQRDWCLGGKCYYVIKGRLIYGSDQNSGSNFAGPEFEIANEHTTDVNGYSLYSPAAAYNEDDHQYAVVYTKFKPSTLSSEGIFGQMLSSHASEPNVLTGVFEGFEVVGAGTFVSQQNPDISWSRHAATFLVVWEDWWPSNVDTIQATYLYDKYQGSGKNQVLEFGSWTVAPHPSQSSTASKDEYSEPSVAYDEDHHNFVIVYTHTEQDGINYDKKIYGQRFQHIPQPSQYVSSPLPVETYLDTKYSNHHSPQVSYSGRNDEMYVLYVTQYNEMGDYFDQVYQRTLKANNVNSRFLVHTGAAKSMVATTTAAAANDGRALVVWDEEYYQDPHDYDVYAQRIKSLSVTYLPSVLR